MIPPDQEIYEVEQRIAIRRAQVARNSKEVSHRAIQKLASPLALIAAAGLGFVLVRGVAKKRKEPEHPQRRQSDHTKAAKATGLAGLIMPIAMWMIRAQWGSPVQAAQFFLQKYQKRGKAKPVAVPSPALRVVPPPPRVSPRRDMARP
jgi:hypothetical protein